MKPIPLQKLPQKPAPQPAGTPQKDNATARELRAPVPQPAESLPRRPWVTAKEIAAAAECHVRTVLDRMAQFRVRPESPAALPHNWRLGRPYRVPYCVAVAWIDVRNHDEEART